MVSFYQTLQTREAKHLTFRVVRFYQPITVEQEVVARGENGFFLLVEHARHQAKRHPSCPQLVDPAVVSLAGGVVAGVGIDETATLWVEDAVEAGNERVGWYVCTHELVGLLQYLPRSNAPSSGDCTQHALSVGHHQGCRHPLSRDVAYDQAHLAVLEAEEVVEISSYLSRGLVVVGYLPALELWQGLREQGVLDPPRHPELLLGRVVVGLKLLVGHLELLIGHLELLVRCLKIFACTLDLGPATHEYPGDPKEHEAHGDAVGEHEGGQLALCSLLKPGQRSEVQAPLVSGNFDVAHFGEEGLVPSLPGAFYAVAIIEQRAQRRARAVVDLEIYGRVERSLEDPIEKHVAYDGTNDESLKRAPTLGDGPQRLVLLVDRKVHDEATFQGKISAMARGRLSKHVNHLRSLRLSGVPRLVHGLPVHRIGVEVVVEPFLIRGVEGTDVGYGEVLLSFATRDQVGVKGR